MVDLKLKRTSYTNIKQLNAKQSEAGVGESLEQAFKRIYQMKNSVSDVAKLKEVEQAMLNGKIGREVFALENHKKLTKAEMLRLYKRLVDLENQEVLDNMVKDMPSNYILIQTIEDLKILVTKAMQERYIIFDVESTGVDVWTDKIVGHVITCPKLDIHYYIPTGHNTLDSQVDEKSVLKLLKPLYENTNVKKIAHNALYDIHMLDRNNIRLQGLVWDTQEAMKLLNEEEPSFALKVLATKYLKRNSKTYGELFGKKGFNEISDLKIAMAYACKDGDITNELFKFQLEHMKKMPSMLEYFKNVEVPLIQVVMDMEKTGYTLDITFAKKYQQELEDELNQIEQRLNLILGDINLNSPMQVKPKFEQLLGKKLTNLDAKAVLKPLSKQYDFIEDYLKYKAIQKLLGTYITVLPTKIKSYDGKLHGSFRQNGTVTGRFSSSGDFNAQNQPKEVRPLFIASPGKVLLSGDFSQQEVRCVAYLSQEPVLLEAYEKGQDIYATMASAIYKKPIEECGDGTDYRKKAKVGVLSTIYNTGANTLAIQMGVSKKDAQWFIDTLKSTMPTLFKWAEGNVQYAKKYGYVWFDKKQRKKHLFAANHNNGTIAKFFNLQDKKNANGKIEVDRFGRKLTKLQLAENLKYKHQHMLPTNNQVQGTSAIQTKVTMIGLDKLCKQKTLEGNGEWRLWATVHDEVILEVPEIITKEDVKDFENVMLESYKFGSVPNKTDIEISKAWGKGMSVNTWFSGKKEENGTMTKTTDKLYIEKWRTFGKRAGREVIRTFVFNNTEEERRDFVDYELDGIDLESGSIEDFVTKGSLGSFEYGNYGGDWDEPTGYGYNVITIQDKVQQIKDNYAKEMKKLEQYL